MKTKYIIFTEPKKVEILEAEVEAPKEYEVQVRLERSSISSGTERANLSGEQNVNLNGPTSYPRHAGYSSAGVVEQVGIGVTKVKPGDRVALAWSVHSAVQNLSQDFVYKISDEISFQDAALFHIATFPLAAIRKCHLEIGESAIVMGMGILGLIAIPLLKAAGAVPVIAADPIEKKRKLALYYGADYALDPYSEDFAKTVQSLTDGGVNVAIEVTGCGKALDQVLDCIKPMGRVALLGCTRKSDFTIDYYHKVHGPGISLIGAHTLARPKVESSPGLWTRSDDMKALIRLSEKGRIQLGHMVEEAHNISEALEVYNRLLEQPYFPITQFVWKNNNHWNYKEID